MKLKPLVVAEIHYMIMSFANQCSTETNERELS